MARQCWLRQCRQVGFAVSWGLMGAIAELCGGVIFGSDDAIAQPLPDETLGTERSEVNPIDALTDRIDGGATRGSNLFHSFQEFNVDEGRGVYFANPVGIENILSRVTGESRSDILGTLGVLGSADLFLINPNGILFGVVIFCKG